MRLAAGSTTIAGVLSIAAILAPAASAQFNLDPTTVAQEQPTALSTVVRPNPHQRTSQSTGGPPILRLARASEAAALNHSEAQERAAASYSPRAGARYGSGDPVAYAALPHPVAASSLPVKAPAGFDYGAAAVGAGLAVVIVVVITVGGLVVRRRRQPQFG